MTKETYGKSEVSWGPIGSSSDPERVDAIGCMTSDVWGASSADRGHHIFAEIDSAVAGFAYVRRYARLVKAPAPYHLENRQSVVTGGNVPSLRIICREHTSLH